MLTFHVLFFVMSNSLQKISCVIISFTMHIFFVYFDDPPENSIEAKTVTGMKFVTGIFHLSVFSDCWTAADYYREFSIYRYLLGFGGKLGQRYS